ncbi:DUF998 domain-containing protein [Antrihabitans stalactiti]|uniref:DUF998 domain-containing protein n=1 Tax=Antrihabitans stalactiti TaxID=2584121 RepID=A0A848KMX0_9NOCA|nr:DUF998 domain-containing protein [Antrihabitans stalactiti]NMN99561.1 DUF998 domain-containing protein [Antrihabitans stalactiti]
MTRLTQHGYATIAGASWVATALYFPVSVAVAATWSPPYNVREHLISDLGTARSPAQVWMNLTFIGIGVLTATGAAALACVREGRTAARSVACVLLVVAGMANVAVGLVPSDGDATLHKLAAVTYFLAHVGAMALLLLAFGHARPALAAWTATFIVVAIAGSVALVDDGHFGLGAGVAERFALDTLAVWRIGVGLSLLAVEFRRFRS